MALRTRKRADGSVAYQVVFRHKGKQTSRTFDNARAAQVFDRNITRLGVEAALDMVEAHTLSQNAPTLAEWCRRYTSQIDGITDGTRREYQKLIDRIEKRYPLMGYPIDGISEETLQAWLRTQEREKLAAKTIKNRHALISAALQSAQEAGLVRTNLAKGLKIKRTERAEMVILMPDEFQNLVAQIHLPAYRDLVIFAYSTGLRFGEITALKVRDLRTNENPPTVSIVRAWKYTSGAGHEVGPPKTQRGRRTIAFPAALLPMLASNTAGKRPDDWLFTNQAGGHIKHQTLWDAWAKWVKTADLGKTPRFHDLRHSHASWMIGQGMNLSDLQRRLGHESIKTTVDTYGHLLPEAQVQAARHAANMVAGLVDLVPQIED